MSCCAGKCGCGANCNCSNGCGGCKMYPDLAGEGNNTSATIILGVAATTQKGFSEGEGFAENGGCGNSSCSCGSSCTCGSGCKCGK